MNARAKKETFVDMVNMKTRTVYLPQLKIEGKWACLQDLSTPSGMAEEVTQERALYRALERYFKRMGERDE